jgi:acyl dehydratase
LVGRFERDLYRGRVDEDAVAAYALATNDPNSLYLEGKAVPPLFTATLILPAQWEAARAVGDVVAIRGPGGAVHGEHDVYFWGIVQPGMSLQWDAGLHSVKQTRGGVLVTHRVLVSDLEGAPLVEHLWSNFHIGGTIEGDDVGSDLVEHLFPEEGRGRLVGSQAVAVDRDQAFRYAGVSSDHAGHAIDDVIAREQGYPSKILQGLCTFALCAGAVVDIGVDGDPRRLRRLAGRFSAPAFPRRDLVVNVHELGQSAEGGRALGFEATQDGVIVIKHGRAELVPERS